MGASMDYASNPTVLTGFDDQMSFIERVSNAVQAELFSIVQNWWVIGPLEERIRRDIPGAKSLNEIRGRASLLMINSHPSTDWPRSLPPNVIPIGALHTRPAKPLPQV